MIPLCQAKGVRSWGLRDGDRRAPNAGGRKSDGMRRLLYYLTVKMSDLLSATVASLDARIRFILLAFKSPLRAHVWNIRTGPGGLRPEPMTFLSY
jgi:hypothetical protein